MNTNLLDNVILKQVVIQPSKKPRSVGPHKLRSRTTTNKQKSCLKLKNFRSASTQLRRGSTEPIRDGTNILQHHLFYTNEDLKHYTFINVGTSIPIVTWKLTKNRLHIISDRPLSSCLSYSGSYERFKLDVESLSIQMKDIGLFYRLIRRFSLTSEITRPDIQDCLTVHPYSQ